MFTFQFTSYNLLPSMAQKVRLYTQQPLTENACISFSPEQSHYLVNVMRLSVGDSVLLFNGKDGLWHSEINSLAKKSVTAISIFKQQEQISSTDLWLAFSPIKNKTETVVEKATELGISCIMPVITSHSVVRSLNYDKLQKHAIEAAEQCERLDVPKITTYQNLAALISGWNSSRILLYGDESGGGKPISEVVNSIKNNKDQSLGILIGPEGGFSAEEFSLLRTCSFAVPFGMGARILRADTAAVAAIACVQAQLGDWHMTPHFRS